MTYLLGGLVIAFMVLLAVGAITGRVRARSCCGIADPSRDLRMRNSLPPAQDAAPGATGGRALPLTAGSTPTSSGGASTA